MKQAGSARVARASSRRSRVGGHANGPEEKLSRSEVGGWRVTGDSESRDRGWGVVSRDIRDHERDAPPATGGGGTLGAHQGLSGPGGGAGAHRRRRCALETEIAEARAKLRKVSRICQKKSGGSTPLHSGRRGCRARPMSTAMASGGRSPFQALARVVYRHPVLVYLASLLVPALLAIGAVRDPPFRESLVRFLLVRGPRRRPSAHRTA